MGKALRALVVVGFVLAACATPAAPASVATVPAAASPTAALAVASSPSPALAATPVPPSPTAVATPTPLASPSVASAAATAPAATTAPAAASAPAATPSPAPAAAPTVSPAAPAPAAPTAAPTATGPPPPAPTASAGCVEEGAELRVQSGAVTVRGAFFRPVGAGPFPAVLVLHTRGGLNAHALAEASWFASQGFIAYAPDYFSPVGVTPLSFDRQTFTARYTDAVVAHLERAVACLRGRADVSGGRVGAVGFSMGGYIAAVLATRPGIVAAAGWYAAYAGAPVNQVPAQQDWSTVAAAVRVPLLLLHGDADVEVRIDFARRAQAELQRSGKRSELVVYPGVAHGYDQEGSSLYRHDAAATADSRTRTIALLRTAP